MIIYCVLSSIVWIAVVLLLMRRYRDNLNIVSVLLMFYILNYPIKLIATKFGIHLIDSNQFGEGYQLTAIILSDVTTLFILLGFRLGSRVRPFKIVRESEDIQAVYGLWFWGLLFVLCGFMTYGATSVTRMFSYTEMLEFRTYRAEHRLGNGILGLLMVVMDLCFFAIIYAWVHIRKRTIRSKVLALLILCFMWYTFANTLSKTSALSPVVVAVLMWNIKEVKAGRKGIKVRNIILLGIAGVALISMIELMDVKTIENISVGERVYLAIKSFFNPSYDVIDNLTAILYRVKDPVLGDLRWMPFLYNLILSKIPRSIWRTKYPGDGKLMIIEHILPEFYDGLQSSAASPSILGDALVSGGILLVLLAVLIYGFLFYWIYRKAMSSEKWVWVVLYCYSFIGLNSFCRDGSGILGNTILAGILLIILDTCYSKIVLRIRLTRKTIGSYRNRVES